MAETARRYNQILSIAQTRRSRGEGSRFFNNCTLGLLVEGALRQQPWRARCVERRTASSASGLGNRAGAITGPFPRADSTGGRRPNPAISDVAYSGISAWPPHSERRELIGYFRGGRRQGRGLLGNKPAVTGQAYPRQRGTWLSGLVLPLPPLALCAVRQQLA